MYFVELKKLINVNPCLHILYDVVEKLNCEIMFKSVPRTNQ